MNKSLKSSEKLDKQECVNDQDEKTSQDELTFVNIKKEISKDVKEEDDHVSVDNIPSGRYNLVR